VNDRFVHTLWCDDIRQEVGNKTSFMGVYTGGLVLPSLPALLPRLGIWTWVTTSIDQPFKTLSMQIVRDDGSKLADLEITDIQPINGEESVPDTTRQTYMAGFSVGPVEIPAGCRYFQVLVQTESELLEGPKLRISVNPQLLEQINNILGATAIPAVE
jgi:hypothetical protein